MPSARLDTILILDAVPPGEAQTSRRLREDIEDASLAAGRSIDIRIKKIAAAEDLEASLKSLESEVITANIYPWIHIDGHGLRDESGFITANGEPVKWEALNELLTPINVSTGLHVFLILSMCQGGSFARSIRTTDRAPVLGVIGPVREITSEDVIADYSPFYATFVKSNSIRASLAALDARHAKHLYYRTNAEAFFYDVWRGYKQNLCTPEALRSRAEAIQAKLRDEGTPNLPDIETLERQLEEIEPAEFNRFRDHFFMYDLYPENKHRFSVTYEAGSEYAAS